MSYLLDTCVLSKLRRISKFPDKKLQNWIEQHPASQYFISTFSLSEILAGISKLDDTLLDRKYKMELEDWLFNDLIPDFDGRIINFDLKLALRWGALIGNLKKKGINLPIIDSLIAVTAIHHDFTLVTENTIDFEQTGAMIINPWNFCGL